MPFQTPRNPNLDRTDHIWARIAGRYKCVCCGAVCNVPPNYPTPADWMAEKYEELTIDERGMMPRGK